MKTFKGDFDKFYNKLINRENFAFQKYSDGELYILENKELILGPSPHHHSYQAEEDKKHFNPAKHQHIRSQLFESFKYKHDNYYMGICGPSEYEDKIFYWMKNESGQNEEHLTWANLFVNSNYAHFREKFVPELSKTKNIIVCNKKSTVENLPFKVEKDFRVGTNCIVNDLGLIDEMKKFVSENKIKNHVFLIAASTLGNLLIYELSKIEPENTYIDVGSTLNPLLGLSVDRGYLRAYGGQLWRGKDTSSDLVKEELWKL